MSGVHWTDVRPSLPQPHQAHDAALGDRTVQARFWILLTAETPYQLEFRLCESGRLIERWTIGYRRLPVAAALYEEARMCSERFLTGGSAEKARPTGQHLWHFEKGAP